MEKEFQEQLRKRAQEHLAIRGVDGCVHFQVKIIASTWEMYSGIFEALWGKNASQEVFDSVVFEFFGACLGAIQALEHLQSKAAELTQEEAQHIRWKQ